MVSPSTFFANNWYANKKRNSLTNKMETEALRKHILDFVAIHYKLQLLQKMNKNDFDRLLQCYYMI